MVSKLLVTHYLDNWSPRVALGLPGTWLDPPVVQPQSSKAPAVKLLLACFATFPQDPGVECEPSIRGRGSRTRFSGGSSCSVAALTLLRPPQPRVTQLILLLLWPCKSTEPAEASKQGAGRL